MDITTGADLLFSHLEPSLFDYLIDDIGMGDASTVCASSSTATMPSAPQHTSSDLDPESGSGFVFIPRAAVDEPVIPTPTVRRRPKWKKPVQEPPPPERAVVTAKLAEQSHWWQDEEFSVDEHAYNAWDLPVEQPEQPPVEQSDEEKSSFQILSTRSFLDDLLDACGQGKLLQNGMVCSKFTLLKACLHNKPLKEMESKLRRAMSAFEYSVHGKIDTGIPVIHPQTPGGSLPLQIDKDKMDQLAASLDDEILKTPSYSGKAVRRRARKVVPAAAVTSGPLDTSKYTVEGIETEQNRLTDEESSDEESSDDDDEFVNDGAVAVFHLALKLSLEARSEHAVLELDAEEQPLAEMDMSSSAEPFVQNLHGDSATKECDAVRSSAEEELSRGTEQPVTSALNVSPEILIKIQASRLVKNSQRAPENLAEEFECGLDLECAGSIRSKSCARIAAPTETAKWQDPSRSSESVENSHFPYLPDPEAVFRKGKSKRNAVKRTRDDVSASPQKTPKRHNIIIPNSRFAYRRGPETELPIPEVIERKPQTSRTEARKTQRSKQSDKGHSSGKKVVVCVPSRHLLDTESDSEPDEQEDPEVITIDDSTTGIASSTNTSTSETRPARLDHDNAMSPCSSPEIPLRQFIRVPAKKSLERSIVIRSKNARLNSSPRKGNPKGRQY